ncbi:unnamed protein product [Heterobilharzia americana]|nr:unnamed protein product [Heterobilharzia americana]
MFTHDIKDGSEQDGIEERTTMLKEYTEGNIEILDYLQGISGLERDFTRLADSIVNAATTLSDRNNVVHSNRIYEKDTGASVDKCWQYISQLSEAIHFHISKSHEYHKLHHEIWAARMEMQQVLSSYSLIQEKLSSLSLLTDDSLATIKKMIEAQLNLNAEERGMMQDEANEQSRLILDTVRTDLNFRPSTYVTKKRKSRNSHKHSSTISSGMKGVNEDKQLVTSFTNSIPKTFKLNNSDSACDHREYEEPLMKHSLNAQITQIPSQDHVKFTKQTRELMTQIDSPFYSAVVYCPSCSEFHEISILSPFACKAETYSSNIQSLSETSDTSESHLKAAHSMPSLHMTTKNINFDEDRILAVGNKNSSVSRKFFRSKGRNKPRPQSVSASLTETTASSGLDSPSESSIVVKNKKCSSKSHRRVDGETHKEEAGKSPFLWWYKRGKRIPKDVSLQAPGSPYTEPGPPGRRSPLNIAPSEPTSDINKQSPTPFAVVERNRRNSNEETGPVVHSYSWIQRGMPWGCNPPIAAQRSPHAQQERSRHVNVHSERIKVKTRKHLKHHSFERNIDHHPFGETHLYNTIDSGIQTDTDIYPTGNLDIPLLDSEPDLQQVPMNSEYICQYCNRSMRKIVHQDSSVQCDFINCDILSKTLCHKMAPVSSQTVQVTNQIPRGRFITNSVRVWNVSCQVGTVKRNQSTEPITTEDISCYKASVYDKGEDTRRYAKYNERPRSFETPMRRLTQLGLPTGTTPAPLMFLYHVKLVRL